MSHWAQKRERGNRFVLKLSALLVKYTPAWMMKIITVLIVSYFYLTSPQERRAIAEYQQKLAAYTGKTPFKVRSVFTQFLQFAEAIQDRFAVWQQRLTYEDIAIFDPDNLYADIRNSGNGERGQMLVCSHLGNVEICRTLAVHHKMLKLNVLVHSKHAEAFNAVLQELGGSTLNLIQVSELDMATMLQLEERVAQGEWIAIAADRVPVRGEKTVEVDFLNASADFPQGPWLLAGLLKTPVNLLFCHKVSGKYQLHLSRLTDKINWGKRQREESVKYWSQRFADELAKRCAEVPLQWFNFYSFWKK
ncbi:putative LPLAT superfamily acyltransferase [Cricetibacter osteomyelitidis]|uniref:Putative LPLAT superfamily acyltransferase n=1 Tax=Cricetibacter osteomyelitidis TaxID=1521931 RepID=A0A4R2TCR9_9PAST|nr:glycosyl transferase family 2 [Cricetibacter osteomyelitidis]TCP94898.1 putative LPLAT superfamily acyltransferase [Cricetibacter osteomyelitidis]